MASPNNPFSSEFFSHAQNLSFQDSIVSNTSGHLISVRIVNHLPQGNFQVPARLLSEDHDLQPPFGQMTEEYPIIHGPPAPGKSNNPFALNGDDLEAEITDPPFNSPNESYSDPSSVWGDGPLQHQELPNAIGSGSWSSTNSSLTNSSLVSLIPDNESDFSPSETMSRCSSSNEIYVKAMLSIRHGYPLPAPQPISSLPVEKRRVGTIIGDVGTIRDDGSFDYLFNPLLPTTDPRNPHDLPTGFDDVLPPVARTHEDRSAFNSRTALCSLGSHCETMRETMELSISHTSDNGALLFLPDGASQEDLLNSAEMKRFIVKYAETWISYAISTGRDIDRNSLYFVTGCTKAGDWGMATFNRSTREESSLKLGQSTHPKDPRYIWERSRGCRMARTGPGPDEELDNESAVPQNQTLFIKGYKIAFSENAWMRILAESHGTMEANAGQPLNGSTSELNPGSSQTSGGSQAPSSGSATYSTSNCNRMNLEPFPAGDKLFHPLDTINKVLLEEIPDAQIAIAHDDDWCEVTNGYDPIDSELVVQLLRLKYSASSYEGTAVLSAKQDAMSVGDEIIDLDTTAENLRTGSDSRDNYYPLPVSFAPHDLRSEEPLEPGGTGLNLRGPDARRRRENFGISLNVPNSHSQKIRYQCQLEALELSKKYAGLLDPLYNRRKAIVTGNCQPNEAELKAGETGLREVLGKEFQPQPTTHRPQRNNRISNFWLAVWMNHPGLSKVITERDKKALEYLIDIRCTYLTGRPVSPVKLAAISSAGVAAGSSAPSNSLAISSRAPRSDDVGYKLSFDFSSSNPYFTDHTLEKTYYYKNGQLDGFGEFLYAKSVGCAIHWKSGMDLTAANAAGDAGGPISFFTFFQPKSLPSESEVNNGDYTAFLDEIKRDFECGRDIRNEIIPFALTYLLDPPPFDDDSDEDEEDEGEESDDDDD